MIPPSLAAPTIAVASLLATLTDASALPNGGGCAIGYGQSGRKTCTVTAIGNSQDDVPNILKAFSECGHGGTVVFPQSQNYWIGTRLNPVVADVDIQWRGLWTFSDNLTYWRNNSYPIAFQNHRAGFVLTGDGIRIDGYGTGGIYGNGNAWYNAEKNVTQPGRPMPFVFWNVSKVEVRNFFVKDPPLWSLNIMNGYGDYGDLDCMLPVLSC
jgi:galacturan 1,4-alpha-galacturonidase